MFGKLSLTAIPFNHLITMGAVAGATLLALASERTQQFLRELSAHETNGYTAIRFEEYRRAVLINID